jgi:hypothetical protein
MHQHNKLITGPTVEPVSLAEAKQHARIEYPDDDDLVAGLITAARLVCENEIARAFIAQTWETYLDAWPFPAQPLGPMYFGSAYIPQVLGYPYTPYTMMQVDNPDLISVESIQYLDVHGNIQTLDPSQYLIQTGAPGRMYPAYGVTWPSVRCVPGAITIRYQAGYGPLPSDVPANAQLAIKMMVAELYEQREMTATQAYQCNPIFQALLAPLAWGSYP